MSTRQARRARLRELQTMADQAITRGLPRRATGLGLLAVVARVADEIDRARDATGIAAAARTVHRLFEASIRAQPPAVDLACRRGCAYCCHVTIAALLPEIVLVALAARSAGDRLDAIATAALSVRGLDPGQRPGRKIACPMLAGDGCSVYPERPTMCRVATSTNVAACIDEYEGRDLGGEIPIAVAPVDHGFNARVVLVAASRLTGRDDRLYDLALGLDACRELDSVTRRWVAGEAAFIDMPTLPLDAAVGTQADALVRGYRELLG